MSKATPRHKVDNGDNDQSQIIVPGRDEKTAPDDPDQLSLPEEVPVLPVRETVTFPGTIVPLTVDRERSRRMLSEALPEEKVILVVSQKTTDVEEPAEDDLHQTGTAMMVLKLLRTEDGGQNLLVQGLGRAQVSRWVSFQPYIRARIEPLAEVFEPSTETEALLLNVRNLAREVIDLSPNIPEEANTVLANIDQPGALSDFLAANLPMDPSTKQQLLEQTDVTRRLRQISEELQKRVEILQLSQKIQSQVRDKIDQSQREYFLNEQLKAIQKELGRTDGTDSEIKSLREKLESADMPETVREEAFRELNRLEAIPQASPEHHMVRTYLELMSELPWSVEGEEELDVNRAAEVLDEDHYDLEKVKRRILEYLAVRKLAPESRGPILCFVGPPGVGKTSLGQSIARALGRKFIRMSLGGIRDEAELRGHRRTYIGSMPGRIIQEIRKAGTQNPVFMLDELDKVGADFRGDPTSALLEILDPAQNNTFQDHYLNVPYDLSKVVFIATANYIGNVPPPLRDRMEVIELPGYTQSEKLHIARKYLVPRQLKENGLSPSQCKWKDAAIRRIIQDYTREAGVRELERQIGACTRGVAAMVARGKAKTRTVNTSLVVELLGPRKYESELAQRTRTPGVATGLAYTTTGGTILFVEAAAYPGRGQLTLTGQIGDVMKESAQASLSLVKSKAAGEHMDPEQFAKRDIHVHVPAGAVPKDGPSAGVAMFTALMSLVTGRVVKGNVAMTGEITLRGLVLPIGGVKEKVLAAKQAGIKTVILPAANEKDLAEVPDEAKKALSFVFAEDVDDVLCNALEGGLPEGCGDQARPQSRKKQATGRKAKKKSAGKGGKRKIRKTTR